MPNSKRPAGRRFRSRTVRRRPYFSSAKIWMPRSRGSRHLDRVDAPVEQPWLWREARLTDPAGNRLCLYQADENRRFPPWRIDDPQESKGDSSFRWNDAG